MLLMLVGLQGSGQPTTSAKLTGGPEGATIRKTADYFGAPTWEVSINRPRDRTLSVKLSWQTTLTTPYPGGQSSARPASRWKCRWSTDCPASRPQLTTTR